MSESEKPSKGMQYIISKFGQPFVDYSDALDQVEIDCQHIREFFLNQDIEIDFCYKIPNTNVTISWKKYSAQYTIFVGIDKISPLPIVHCSDEAKLMIKKHLPQFFIAFSKDVKKRLELGE